MKQASHRKCKQVFHQKNYFNLKQQLWENKVHIISRPKQGADFLVKSPLLSLTALQCYIYIRFLMIEMYVCPVLVVCTQFLTCFITIVMKHVKKWVYMAQKVRIFALQPAEMAGSRHTCQTLCLSPAKSWSLNLSLFEVQNALTVKVYFQSSGVMHPAAFL